jgi:hypothetical protein
VPGRVGRRAQLTAQARPDGLFFGPGRHDAEDSPMGRGSARHYRPAAAETGSAPWRRSSAPAESGVHNKYVLIMN